MGRTDAAPASMHRAEALDPRAPIIEAAIGWVLYLGRRHAEAVAVLEHTAADYPDVVPAPLCSPGPCRPRFARLVDALNLPAR